MQQSIKAFFITTGLVLAGFVGGAVTSQANPALFAPVKDSVVYYMGGADGRTGVEHELHLQRCTMFAFNCKTEVQDDIWSYDGCVNLSKLRKSMEHVGFFETYTTYCTKKA